MVRLKLPPSERRSEPVYVLLRPRERRMLEQVAKHQGTKSLGAVLRQAFLKKYMKGA